jgi:transposase
MADNTEVFVGIDVAKSRNAVAIADGERGGEVRFLASMRAVCWFIRMTLSPIGSTAVA